MNQVVEHTTSDIDAMNDQFHNLLAQNMEEALIQCRKAKLISLSISYTKGILDAEFNNAWYHLWRCEFHLAFPLLKDLPEKYKALDDDFGYLRAITSLGVIHLDMGNYDSALPYFLSSLKVARKKNQREREASILANLGLLYEGLDQIEYAYDYFSEALAIPEINDSGFYTASKCLALYFINKKQWKNAEHFLSHTLSTSREKHDFHFESELLITQGKLHKGKKEDKAAQQCFMKSFQISQKLGNVKIETESIYELGCLALEQEKIELALSYFDHVMVLAKDNDIGSFICKSYNKLSVVYEQKKDYLQALQYLKKYNTAEKRYNLQQTELRLKSLSFEYELEKKQQLAEVYRLKNIELEKANQKIMALANHDSLTGLPNRRLLMEHLKLSTSIAEKNNSKIAILFIDLDNFKPVNDQFGHRAGDTLLQEFSKRMTKRLSDNCEIARFGGDEFVIIIPDIKDNTDIHSITTQIIEFINEDFFVIEHQFRLGTSIGISIYPDHGRDIEDLLSKADQAMYSAKISGKNKYVLYRT